MSNFTFLAADFPEIAASALQAERYAYRDPRSACFYVRRALEQAVLWLYTHDQSFGAVYDENLSALLTSPAFRDNVPTPVAGKAHLIRKLGNQAVHTNIQISARDSFTMLKELYQFLYWLAHLHTWRPTPDSPRFRRKQNPAFGS